MHAWPRNALAVHIFISTTTAHRSLASVRVHDAVGIMGCGGVGGGEGGGGDGGKLGGGGKGGGGEGGGEGGGDGGALAVGKLHRAEL